jgi:hypothetical protein
VRIVRHYVAKDSVDADTASAVEDFWTSVHKEEKKDESVDYQVPDPPNARGQAQAASQSNVITLVKREPASFLDFDTIMNGPRVIIDLTRIGEENDGEERENVDALQANLSDNYLPPIPPDSIDSSLKRTYRLADQAISQTFKEQCIKFGEWRSALWSWSRDGPAVTATTVDGNISNLLLFAGFCTTHAPLAHRIVPPTSFDLGAVFGSHSILEPLALSYLRWLRGVRGVMYSTTLGYLNSLVVMARFYFASDSANSSFDAGENEHAVVGGLRRLRSHAHSAAEKERKQKPVHPDWLSWRACQWARRRAARAYLRQREGPQGQELRELYRELVEKRSRASSSTKAAALRVLHHPLYVSLRELVCLYLHTIAPPVRVAITRGLQFRSTFVKLRRDPARYVIDLKNNPQSVSARHKTCAHYRHAILPQPQIERMTELVDALRGFKLTELNPKRYVFINQHGKPFSSSAWTGFVKRAWRNFSRPSDDAEDKSLPRQPPPSLCRTIFVTWLNSVPYNEQDRSALEELQRSAADFQTHTLETANRLYDKDAASYERLLDLTTFCEEWSLSVAGGALKDNEWDENLDSDDDRFDATTPVPRRHRDQAENIEGKEDAENDEPEQENSEPSPLDPIVNDEELNGQDEDAAPVPSASEPKRYLPEEILDRRTELVYSRKKARFGGTRKKVTGWCDQVLVKWDGYSVAESTWEFDVAFYKEHYPQLLAAQKEAGTPERLVAKKKHPETGLAYYKVKWQGSECTTMEAVDWVERSPRFREVLVVFDPEKWGSHDRGSAPHATVIHPPAYPQHEQP